MDTVAQRLDRLERENRWWKVLGIAAVAVLGLVVLMGAKGIGVLAQLRVKHLLIVDDDGKVRAEMGGEGNVTSLIFYDETKEPLIMLTGITNILPKGSKKKTGGYNSSFISFKGPDEGSMVTLGWDHPQEAGLQIQYKGEPLIFLSASTLSGSFLFLRDTDGAASVSLKAPSEEFDVGVPKGPALVLYKKNKAIWRAP